VCCSILQCVAVCCSVLQCVAVCCSCRHLYMYSYMHCVLQCVVVCCSVLQCVAACCSVLQCVAVCCSCRHLYMYSYMYCVLQCRSVLQCVAACCSVLQCVAMYCSVLQYVAMCCSCRHLYIYSYIHLFFKCVRKFKRNERISEDFFTEKNIQRFSHIWRFCKYLLSRASLSLWYSRLQIAWHRISRLFRKPFQRTRILPMKFTISTM